MPEGAHKFGLAIRPGRTIALTLSDPRVHGRTVTVGLTAEEAQDLGTLLTTMAAYMTEFK